LVGFVTEGGEFGFGKDVGADEKLKPLGAFIELLQTIADLGDEFGLGSGALGFAVIRTNGSARAEDLLAKHPRFVRFRQTDEHSPHAKREFRSPLDQV